MDDITKLQVESWLGKDNQIGVDIWERKYRYDHENLEHVFDSVTHASAQRRFLCRHCSYTRENLQGERRKRRNRIK